MNIPILEPPVTRWYCPNCAQTDTTREHRPHTRMHTCAGLKGISAPFIAEGERGGIRAVVRDDYLGKDLQTLDEDGRPIMAVVREREDGNDVWVNAGCAVVKIDN